jgi:hypothetical protein
MMRKTTTIIRIMADQNPALNIPPATWQLLNMARIKITNDKMFLIVNPDLKVPDKKSCF